MAILVLATLAVCAVSAAVLLEQKVVNHELRASQAFEAAEAGLQHALAYLGAGPDRDRDGTLDPVFDADGDGLGESMALRVGSASVAVTVAASGADLQRLTVVARGLSDDGSASRTLSRELLRLDPLPVLPGHPLVVRGAVEVAGVLDIHNTESAHSLRSGGGLVSSRDGHTVTAVPDPGHVAYPACLAQPGTCLLAAASGNGMAGPDLAVHDAALAALAPDQLFRNFFGLPPQRYRELLVTLDLPPGATAAALALAGHEVIRVGGNLVVDGGTPGCSMALDGGKTCPPQTQRPVILIVDGDLDLAGTVRLSGLLFVRGNLRVAGTATIEGAVVVAGGLSAAGHLSVHYHSGLLAEAGGAGPAFGSAGSWKDF